MINIERLDAKNLGMLLQFYILTAIIGSLYLDQNPFDQPGVEDYKKLVNQELENNK